MNTSQDNKTNKRKAVFFDRDGVVCRALPRGEYLTKEDQFVLTDGIIDLIDYCRGKNYLIFVVTNQAQIAKGMLSLEGLDSIHRKMMDLLGNRVDKIYVCPHKNEDNCSCRKPKPGMLLEAAGEFDIDLAKSFIIGDSDKDINAGKTIGCKTIFLKNNFNENESKICRPDFTAINLPGIKDLID